MVIETKGFLAFLCDYLVYNAILHIVAMVGIFAAAILGDMVGIPYQGDRRESALVDQVMILIFMFKYR